MKGEREGPSRSSRLPQICLNLIPKELPSRCSPLASQKNGDQTQIQYQANYSKNGDDLAVSYIKGPTGEHLHDFRDKTSEKHEFIAHNKGLHRFCFTNKSPYHETIDFDVHVGHFSYHEQHAKDGKMPLPEHFNPLMDQISKLEEALYNIQFEQHWLEAQTDRQAIVNDGMSKRAIHKAMFESAALVGASVLQVYLLQRLFERKLGTSRV
uniref:GOLD domain-containing protein n=1 Tax=Cucumis melo TaxID=3656 RepID=A0A9I9E4P1_CUCME